MTLKLKTMIKRILIPLGERLFHYLGHVITRYCHESLGQTCGSCDMNIEDFCVDCPYSSVCECRGDRNE